MKKKHILITGGNKGIGWEATKLFLDAAYFVTIIARDFSGMQKVENCNFVSYDLRDIQGISKLASEIGDIDVLVNNAGVMNVCTYENYPAIKKDDLMKLNLEAPVELITCFAKKMIAKEAILKSVQSGRFAQPEEIAQTIFWLATNSPVYMNGMCLDINDGAFPR